MVDLRVVIVARKEFHGNVGTGLGVGQRIVVGKRVKSAVSCNGLQLMVGQLLEQPPGCQARAVEVVIGIIHLVAAEDRLQATLVNRLVVGDQR